MPSAIDRYRVRRVLDTGGVGIVYAAHDPDLDREVAIRVLPRGVDGTPLEREAQALARSSHPNVVAVHDVGEHVEKDESAVPFRRIVLRRRLET